MKILHVNTNDNGGAAIAAIRLHYTLLDKGVDSKILFLKRSGTAQIREAYYFEDIFSSKAAFNLLFKLNSFYNRRYTFYKPDIYFNGPDSLFNISSHELFCWADVVHLHWVVKFLDWDNVFRHRKKFIWTFHDLNPMTGGQHYMTGYHNEFHRVSLANIKKKKKAIASTDLTIIAPSRWIGDLARESGVFAEKRILTLRNPVNPQVFKVLKNDDKKMIEGVPGNKKIILFVAENPDDERKGFKWLMKAVSGLKEKNDFFLLIIGRKTVEIHGNIESLLLGTIHDEAFMSRVYNLADVFVIPSLEDNLPNTVSEALLCGTPVAGLRAGGIPEMVINYENGFLAEDPGQLDQAILKCLAMNVTKEHIHNRAMAELDPEKLFPKFMDVYRG